MTSLHAPSILSFQGAVSNPDFIRHLSRDEQMPDCGSGLSLEAASVCWRVGLDLRAFGQFQSILYGNAQVTHSAVNLGMAEKDLNCAEVASRLVDD